ncbi:MAG: HNH endonuclease [Deltaproteobacteria bacterium]|nr:HNH endonuclease [Deltaproteobacteria bacterium]
MNRRKTVESRAGRRCEYCRAPQPATGIRYHLDHVIPESRGGTDDVGNLALACPTCNFHKSDHLSGADEQGSDAAPLFNPRKDRWDDHFEFDPRILQLRGKTAKGSGTVNRLQMNHPVQIEARRHWVELKIYPDAPRQ